VNKLAKPLIAGLLCYLLLSLLDGFIASSLRQTSSWIAYIFLKAAAFPVVLEGNTLSTPNMRFDVIPACNGSTTLRILLLTGIFWVGIQEKIKNVHKLLCCVIIIPLALLINGFRLFILVSMSHFLFKPVEGDLHALTGVGIYLLGMILLIALTSLFEGEHKKEHRKSHLLLGISAFIIIFFTYLPFFMWTFQAWKSSPLDRIGYIFVLLSISLIIFSWRRVEKGRPHLKGALAFFLISFGALVTSTLAEINFLSALSFLCLGFASQLMLIGRRFFIVTAPLLILAFIGVPVTAFIINKVLFFILGHSSGTWTQVVQISLAFSMIGLWWYSLKKHRISEKDKFEINEKSLNRFTCYLLIFLVVKLCFHSSAPFTSLKSEINMSYLLGDWAGVNKPVSNIIQGSQVWFRIYSKEGKLVEVIITSSGGNRHHLHPPEYCLTGSGWKISKKESRKILFQGLIEREVGELSLKKDGQKRHFIHWYTDGETYFPDYLSMLAEDTLRRFQGKRTNWYLFRVLATERETLTEDFLKSFSGEIEQDKIYKF
jgi:EpsI family protein